MPYAVKGASGNAPGGKVPPAHVQAMPMMKQHRWVDIWNSAYDKCMKQGGNDKTCQGSAFAQANGVVKASDPDIDEIDRILDGAPAELFETIAELRLADIGEGTLPQWQQLHKIGEHAVQHPSGQRIKLSQDMGDTMIRNFHKKVVRRGVPLDERHLTDQDGRALGWQTDMRWGRRGEGLPGMPDPSGEGPILYGKFRYNKIGVEVLTDEQYKHISPQYALNYTDKETGRTYGPTIVAVAATNNPFLRVRSLQGEEAPEPVILSDGLSLDDRDSSEGEFQVTEQEYQELLEQVKALQTANAEMQTKVASAESRVQQAEEKATLAESRALEEHKLRHIATVDTYLNDLIHRGLPPAVAEKARFLLRNEPSGGEAVIRLGDEDSAPVVNRYQALQGLLEVIPKMPLGATGYAGGDKRPNQQTDEAKLNDAIDATVQDWLKSAGLNKPQSANGTQMA